MELKEWKYCFDCKYDDGNTKPNEEPCIRCMESGISQWKPKDDDISY